MNIAVFGAKGRLGGRVAEIAEKRGHNVWKIDLNYSENALSGVNVCINFASADATRDVAEFCIKKSCPLITGTTGLNGEQRKIIDNLSEYVTVIEKPNFSIGVDMLYRLCDIVSRELKWDCAIVETHRKGKKDAPGGTARSLQTLISKNTGSFSSVETHSLRLGDNVGTHEVTFASNGESLTLTHRALSVDIFALGAVKEAEKLSERRLS